MSVKIHLLRKCDLKTHTEIFTSRAAFLARIIMIMVIFYNIKLIAGIHYVRYKSGLKCIENPDSTPHLNFQE